MRVRELLAYLDRDDRKALRGLAGKMLQGGKSVEEAADEIAAILDVLLPMDVFLAGPVGSLLEIADGPLLHLLARGIVRAAQQVRSKTKGDTN